ncbi:hypothetical protein D3C73_1570350 [compost metagenome]
MHVLDREVEVGQAAFLGEATRQRQRVVVDLARGDMRDGPGEVDGDRAGAGPDIEEPGRVREVRTEVGGGVRDVAHVVRAED